MTSHRSVWTAILLGGLIAGTIDIGAASIIFQVNPIVPLHNIAAGLIGKSAMTGGWQTAALGLLLQWGMSLIIAAIYVFAGRFIPLLRRQWLICGILYGIPVFFVMNFVVLPLSALHVTPHFGAQMFIENMLAMMLFGLIVSYFAREESGVA